jgi:hypothetical protein
MLLDLRVVLFQQFVDVFERPCGLGSVLRNRGFSNNRHDFQHKD